METYKPDKINESRKPALPERNADLVASEFRLDDIWTPGYYGEEANLNNVDDEKKWIIISKEDGTLILKKGLAGETYPITDQYEVSIGNKTCKGQLLSQLMRDVVEKTGVEEASQREGATLIFKKDLLKFIKSKEITSNEVEADSKPIGKGEFGDVVLGEFQDKKDSNKMRKVAIKRVKQSSKYALTGGMELAVMTILTEREDCPYLLSFIGWYLDKEELNVVTEYMPNGSLYEHLKTVFLNKGDNEHKERILLHRFVCQIASGMSAMEKNELLHLDLATRNILLDQNYNAKIADFGLSRPFGSKYSSGVSAIRWAAPEVLDSANNLTSKADVWSFGVLVWEIYSFGSLPYSDIPSNKLKSSLKEGKRLDAPINTPNKMLELMNDCWKYEPKERLSFEGIVKYLNGNVATPSIISLNPPPPLPLKPAKSTNDQPTKPAPKLASGSTSEMEHSQGADVGNTHEPEKGTNDPRTLARSKSDGEAALKANNLEEIRLSGEKGDQNNESHGKGSFLRNFLFSRKKIDLQNVREHAASQITGKKYMQLSDATWGSSEEGAIVDNTRKSETNSNAPESLLRSKSDGEAVLKSSNLQDRPLSNDRKDQKEESHAKPDSSTEFGQFSWE
ncbi:hypothetical protein Aperf_G00000087609 [Anoplocephala perfoliata]